MRESGQARLIRARISVNGRSRLLAGMEAARRACELLGQAPIEELGAAERARLEEAGDARRAAKIDLARLMSSIGEPERARGYWAWVDLLEDPDASGRRWTSAGLKVEELEAPHETPMAWAARNEQELCALRSECAALRESQALSAGLSPASPGEGGARL